MLSWQQKSTKSGPERYLIFGPNHILVTLRWDDGRSAGHENVSRRFFFFKGTGSFWKQIQIMTGSVKTNHVFLRKMFETNVTFWLQVTMKSLQILTNLKLKAVKRKNYQVYQLTLHFLLSIILHLFVKKPVKSYMRLQEQPIIQTLKNEDP